MQGAALVGGLWPYLDHIHISERMAEIMEEDKVAIKEEISTVEDTCTVFVAAEDVKEESTENQGMGKLFFYIFLG